MPRDPMIVEFLKKESATTALIVLLARFGIIRHISRGLRTDPKHIYISSHEIKVFCTDWVKGTRGK